MFNVLAWGKARAARSRSGNRRKSAGQSLAEFALVLPIVLLMSLTGLDFGRAYFGWVELNNVVREAANYAAEHPNAWAATNPDLVARAQYAALIQNEAAAINCDLPVKLPAPDLPNPPDVGQPVTVSITCTFHPITPVIGDVVGNSISITASAAFPIRYGVINGIPIGPGMPNSATITTALSASSGAIGATIHDTATLSGATATASGTVTYTVYTDGLCTTGAINAGTVTVSSGVVPDSNALTFNSTGTWYWQAVYSGDPSNLGDTSSCTSEVLAIGKEGPTIATKLSESTGAIDDTVHDTATLSGATANAGGTVTYSYYRDDQCKHLESDVGTVTVTNGTIPNSNDVQFTSAGTWYWRAVYSGDVNNSGAVSECTGEPLVIKDIYCYVPMLTNDTSSTVQADWESAGFTTTVLFSPLNPPAGSNIKSQSIPKNTKELCASTGITVTW